MLSPETLESSRRMSPGERLALALKMTDESEPYLFCGTPEQVRRKFELLRRENDDRNRRMLSAISRTKPGFYKRCHTIDNELITKCLCNDAAGIMLGIDRAMKSQS